jgi:hypothetical protein
MEESLFLDLSKANLDDLSMREILKGLENISTIKILNLSGNRFTKQVLPEIADLRIIWKRNHGC